VLDAGRQRLARLLVAAEPGRPPIAEMEQFIPVVMAAMKLIKLGVKVIGRQAGLGRRRHLVRRRLDPEFALERTHLNSGHDVVACDRGILAQPQQTARHPHTRESVRRKARVDETPVEPHRPTINVHSGPIADHRSIHPGQHHRRSGDPALPHLRPPRRRQEDVLVALAEDGPREQAGSHARAAPGTPSARARSRIQANASLTSSNWMGKCIPGSSTAADRRSCTARTPLRACP
jgi:hypothetical protein